MTDLFVPAVSAVLAAAYLAAMFAHPDRMSTRRGAAATAIAVVFVAVHAVNVAVTGSLWSALLGALGAAMAAAATVGWVVARERAAGRARPRRVVDDA